MKTMKMLLPMLLVAALAFVSCNTNDDVEPYVYEYLTQAEKTQQINDMKGQYTGLCRFAPDNYFQVFTDSVEVSWTVDATDTTLVIENFPMKAFAKSIVNTQVQEALKNDSTHSLTTRLYLYRPWGSSGPLKNCYFDVIPQGSKELEVVVPLDYGGEVKNTTFVFGTDYRNSISSVGEYVAKETFLFYLILNQIKVENGPTCDAYTLLGFVGKKTK